MSKAFWEWSGGSDVPTPFPNLPSSDGWTLGVEVARLMEANRPEHARQFPDDPPQCHDCAFKAGTAPNGCVPTVMDALKCVIEDEPFYCHHGVEDGEPKRLCTGWRIATTRVPSRDCFPGRGPPCT